MSETSRKIFQIKINPSWPPLPTESNGPQANQKQHSHICTLHMRYLSVHVCVCAYIAITRQFDWWAVAEKFWKLEIDAKLMNDMNSNVCAFVVAAVFFIFLFFDCVNGNRALLNRFSQLTGFGECYPDGHHPIRPVQARNRRMASMARIASMTECLFFAIDEWIMHHIAYFKNKLNFIMLHFRHSSSISSAQLDFEFILIICFTIIFYVLLFLKLLPVFYSAQSTNQKQSQAKQSKVTKAFQMFRFAADSVLCSLNSNRLCDWTKSANRYSIIHFRGGTHTTNPQS